MHHILATLVCREQVSRVGVGPVILHHPRPTVHFTVVEGAPGHDQHAQDNERRLDDIGNNYRPQSTHNGVRASHNCHDHNAPNVQPLIHLYFFERIPFFYGRMFRNFLLSPLKFFGRSAFGIKCFPRGFVILFV